MTHLGDGTCALIDDELADDARERALMHVASCPQCRRAVTDHRLVKARLSSVAADGVRPIEDRLLERLLRIPDASTAGCAELAADIPPQRRPADGGAAEPVLPLVRSDAGRPGRAARRLAGRTPPSWPMQQRPARPPGSAATVAAPRRHDHRRQRGTGARSVAAASIAASVVVGLGGAASRTAAAPAGASVAPRPSVSASSGATGARTVAAVVYRRPS
jgi:hypothetical protein